MKKLLALCLVIVSCVGVAQQQPTGTQTSPNLVYSTANPWQGPAGSTSPGTWSGFVVTESTGGGVSGGNKPGYNVSTGAFMFGYTQSVVAYNYALSTTLKNSGMSWLSYNYAWEYYNQGYSKGNLTANVAFNSISGTALHSKSWSLGPTTEGWTAVSGTETFANPLAVANINSFDLTFSGKDDRYWAGYYGPMVRNPSIRVNYTFDQCSTNPLSSPDCAGYQQALLDQQCTANPLYSTSCPGYAAAYQTQQCTVNPLYSAQCPGYQVAYFNQQCTANPLYAATCPGYAEAYKTQQCNQNGLSDRTCPNYAEAYAKANVLTTTTTTTTAVGSTTTTSTTETASNPATLAISDPVVKSAVTSADTTSAVSPTSVTSTVSVINPPKTAGVESAMSSMSVQPPLTQERQEAKQQEQKKTEGQVARVAALGNVTAAAKDAATASARAKTLEDQAASQGLVVGLMGYVPGFAAYQNAIVPDVLGAQVARQYHKPTVDNRSAQRQLSGSNEIRWRQMVDSQYRTGP